MRFYVNFYCQLHCMSCSSHVNTLASRPLLDRAPDIDHEVRWCVLKLADIVIRGVEEMAPKFTIHLPPTPVGESAPQLPLAKVPQKPHRPLKTGGPPTKSSLVPLTGPAKLKLPSTPQVDKPPKVPATPLPDAKKAVTFTVPPPPKDKSKRKPPKSNKAANVPKAQSGGMSLSDLRACQSALKRLKLNKHSVLFMQPVDPIRDHAPKYGTMF
jgi:transcription initiation factor TFIID subunit 2